MPELLTNDSISDKIEQMIAEAKEYIYLISPYLYHIPKTALNHLINANNRGVRVVLIFKKGLVVQGKEIEKLQILNNLNCFCSDRLHGKLYFNENEGVVSSFNLFSGEPLSSIEFGVHFTRASHPGMFAKVLTDSESILHQSLLMRIEDARLVEVPVVRMKPEKKPPKAPVESSLADSKKLTPKEKQNLILELFSTECKECVIKVEDHERLRVQGAGIVVFTNKERVEIIFVRYAAFNPLKDEVKEYIESQHPGLQIWVTYNRMTINVETSHEVISLFSTIKEALTTFQLV